MAKALKTYTTAPVDYDGFGTKTLVERAGLTERGKAVRLVETPEEYTKWQRMRYGSGLHLAVDEGEWNKLLAYGLAKEG